MKYILKIDSSEMDAFLDIFVGGLKPTSLNSGVQADLINRVTDLGVEYENDRLAGVK